MLRLTNADVFVDNFTPDIYLYPVRCCQRVIHSNSGLTHPVIYEN